MNKQLSATLYIVCSDGSCKTALNEAKKFSGFVRGYRVDKNFQGHGANVIVQVKVQNEADLFTLGNKIKSSSSGIKVIQPTIEVASS